MGRLDVDAMLAEMNSRQISEWMAYQRVNIHPSQRAAATIASTIANCMGSGKRIWTDADFLPRVPMEAEEMEPEEMVTGLMGMFKIPLGV